MKHEETCISTTNYTIDIEYYIANEHQCSLSKSSIQKNPNLQHHHSILVQIDFLMNRVLIIKFQSKTCSGFFVIEKFTLLLQSNAFLNA